MFGPIWHKYNKNSEKKKKSEKEGLDCKKRYTDGKRREGFGLV